MNYRPIVKNSHESSVLIFGCSGIMGRIGKKDSLKILKLALDSGITHFDVARSYGYGEAEKCLGEALRGRRNEVVITTKFGLLPARKSGVLRWLKPAAQSLLSVFPAARSLLRRGAQSLDVAAVKKEFNRQTAQASVETSLRELGTETIDLLLMHNASAQDFTEEMKAFFESLVREGKIRAYGAAGPVEAAPAFSAAFTPGSIFQFQNDILRRGQEKLPSLPGPFLTFSALNPAKTILKRVMAGKKELAALGFSSLSRADVFELMLGYVLSVNPSGAVVCSMLREGHLRANLSAVEKPYFDPAEIKLFADWVSTPDPAVS